jgi:hypothetical protein
MTIEFIDRDISTPTGWDALVMGILSFLHARAAKGECMLTDVTLVVTCDPVTGAPYPRPALHVLATVFSGKTRDQAEKEKADFEFIVRTWGVAGAAEGVVFCSEAWMSTVTMPPGRVPAGLPIPSEDPGRQEVLIVSAQHRLFGSKTFTSVITATEGKRTLAPWTEQPASMEAHGRFAMLVLPALARVDPQTIKMAREAVSLMGGAEIVHDATGRAGN